MNRDELDWFRELNQDPYPKKGFTPELKRTIMNKLDSKKVSRKRYYIIAGIASFLIAFILMVSLQTDVDRLLGKELTPSNEAAEIPNEVVIKREHQNILSVLLLGLSNHTGVTPEYRTIMVAEQDGRIQTVAEGSDILVPYGQNFWRIGSVETVEGTQLTIHQAGMEEKQRYSGQDDDVLEKGNGKGDRVLSETLLFAGQKYLTIEVEEQADGDRLDTRVWTVDMMDFSKQKALAPVHVNLQEVSSDEVNAEEWMLFRQKGKWQAAVVNQASGSISSPKGVLFSPVTTELSSNLISHDELNFSWEDVRRLQPNAIDAFSSYSNDMLAIMTASDIEIYGIEIESGSVETEPSLSIPLEQGDKLIMKHWATDKYRDKWIQVGQEQLGLK